MSNTPTIPTICLYGTRSIGFGYLAAVAGLGSDFGDGEPRAWWSMTDAVLHAVADLRSVGVVGEAWVVEPNGQRRARVSVYLPGNAGGWTWEDAPQWTLSAADIQAAATVGEDQFGG